MGCDRARVWYLVAGLLAFLAGRPSAEAKTKFTWLPSTNQGHSFDLCVNRLSGFEPEVGNGTPGEARYQR